MKSTKTYREQHDYIVQSARKLYEKQGVRKTTLADIAREASMTRELLYYYFSGKDEITEYVFESYIQDAVDTALLWCEAWEGNDFSSNYIKMVYDLVATLRRFVFDQTGMMRPMFSVVREVGVERTFLSRMIDKVAREIYGHEVGEWICRMWPYVDESHFREWYCMSVTGIIGAMRFAERKDDDAIVATMLLSAKHRGESVA